MKIRDPRTLAHAAMVVRAPTVLLTQFLALSAAPQAEHSEQTIRAGVFTTGNHQTLAI